MNKLIDFMPNLIAIFVIVESIRIVYDLTRMKTLGDIIHTKHEWGQMIQVPMVLLAMLMSFQYKGIDNRYEIIVYIGIVVVTIFRIVMGSKIAENGILISSRLCMYDDIEYWEYDNVAEKDIRVLVPSNLNHNKLRSFKLKINAKEKNILLEQFRVHGIVKKGVDHNKYDSNQ